MERKRYRELIAWQKAMELAKLVYQVTKQFPDDERFGLTSQMRRAAVSVPSNIAEGQGRLTKGEFKQFLGHARGSVFEVETQTELASEFGYLAEQQAEKVIELTSEVSRLLNGLTQFNLNVNQIQPHQKLEPKIGIRRPKLETGN